MARRQTVRHGEAAGLGSSRLMFALCCAFAGPMLRLAGMESGGFHLRGNSSQGKTTALKVAASVWGRPSYMQRWRTADNALEATAVQHCDGLLTLDEFGQLDPHVAGECAYMLANDQEKGRATRSGLTRKRRTWRLLFLSSGEVSLADHMAEAGKRTRAGMEVRMLNVPLDAGAGMGGIEALHGHDGPGTLADAIVGAAACQYDSAGRVWLEWACESPPSVMRACVASSPAAATKAKREPAPRTCSDAASGTSAARCRLISSCRRCGSSACRSGEALQAVRRCFEAWLGARGHMDNSEEAAMLRQVRGSPGGQRRGALRLVASGGGQPHAQDLIRVSFLRLLGTDSKPVRSDAEQYGGAHEFSRWGVGASRVHRAARGVPAGGMQGFDADALAKLLPLRGHLVHESGRLTVKHRLPGISKAYVSTFCRRCSAMSPRAALRGPACGSTQPRTL